MRVLARALALGAACAAVVASCSVPTDKSQDVQVVVRYSAQLTARGVLGTGDRDSLFAVALQQSTGDTIRNMAFTWESSDPAIMTVQGSAAGGAEITGVNTGVATITAKAVAFQGAQPGQAPVRVAPSFVIDSIRPKDVRYGQTLTVYGVGLPSIFALNMAGGELEADPFSFTGSDEGLGQRAYWVPFPASTSFPTYFIFSGGQLTLGPAPDSITVDPRDLFEPDTMVPGAIDINGPGVRQPFGGDTLPVLFFNPALYFEEVPTGFSDIDWDRFDRNDTSAVTIIVLSNVFGDTAFSYVSDSLFQCGPNPSICFVPPFPPETYPGWYFTAGFQSCNGMGFSYPQPRVPSYAIAFRKWPTPRLHLVQFYAKQGRYTLASVRGYLRPDRAIPPDRFEDNQLCWQADTNFFDSIGTARKQIRVGVSPPFGVGPFGDSLLTISQLYDVDFYRFRVDPSPFAFDTLVTIQTKARAFGSIDPSDIDVYLYNSLGAFLGVSNNVGSSEQITVTAGPGEYYAVVVDFAGAATVYSMCISKGTACAPPGSAPRARVTARSHGRILPQAALPPTEFDPRRISPRR